MNLQPVVVSGIIKQQAETVNTFSDTASSNVNNNQKVETNNVLSKITDIHQMSVYICYLDKDFQKHAQNNLIYKLTVHYKVTNINVYNLYTED